MEFKSRSLHIKINDEPFVVKYPTLAEFKAHQAKGEEASSVDSLVEFLGKLGLPERAVLSLESGQIEALMGELIASKKN